MGERIGLFGGSFDPIHVGHLVAVRDAMEAHGLDRVIFIPSGRPPHKPGRPLASPEDRAAMIARAIRGERGFALNRWELGRPGPSYTIDTVREFRRRHRSAELYFLIGADMLPDLPTWKDIGTLLELCELLPMARPGVPRPSPSRLALPPPWPARLLARWTKVRAMDVSSSEIRRRLAAGRSVRYLVPDGVERYIREHRLYGA